MSPETSQRERILEGQVKRLTEIGLALSAEKDLDKLLDIILREARAFSTADAGTLYLLGEKGRNLRFAILQNDTMQTTMKAGGKSPELEPVPLYLDDDQPNHANVSSHVALSGEAINIPDVYQAGQFDFTGPRQYDEATGYRSQSMLVIPMKNHANQVVGVLQLLNAKDPRTGEIRPFGDAQVNLVKSLASVTSVALTNAHLIRDLSGELNRVRELQASETDLNQKLSTAYRDLESTNADLTGALKKVRSGRMFIGVFLLLCVIGGGGLFAWNQFFFEENFTAASDGAAGQGRGADASQSYTVAARPVSTSISLAGKLAPLREVTVVSPFDGKVAERFFEYGQEVAEGDLLVRMDTSELVAKIREARTAFIKARQQYTELKHWSTGTDVSRANRALLKTRAAHESARSKLTETKRLYDKGIIPRSEYDSALEQIQSLDYELKSASEELAAVKEKGNPENLEMVRLDFENARDKHLELEKQLARADVRAPVLGIPIMPGGGGDTKAKIIERGVALTQGETLMSLGNLEGFTVKAGIDEVDVGRIAVGQNVAVSGDAFPSMALVGRVTHISSQAGVEGFSRVPTFDVTVTIDTLAPEQKARLKLGMSSNLQVKVYDNPEALLVPIEMVATDGTSSWVRVRQPQSGEVARVPVKTGMTTIDSVEIIEGLKVGDELVM